MPDPCTPAGAACACSGFFCVVGVVILVAGGIIPAVSVVDDAPFFDDPYFQPGSIFLREELNRTPFLISAILISIGIAFIGLSIVLMIVAWVTMRMQRNKRSNPNSNPNRHQQHYLHHHQSDKKAPIEDPEDDDEPTTINMVNSDLAGHRYEHAKSSSPTSMTSDRPRGDINTIGLPPPNGNNHHPHIIGFSYTAGCLPKTYPHLYHHQPNQSQHQQQQQFHPKESCI